MQMKSRKKLSSLLLCMMLIVAMAFGTTGCSDNQNNESPVTTATQENAQSDSNVLGEGNTKFNFIVVDKDGNETPFEIHTNKETVGDALLELELIAGDKGDYGLYVKTVNGITADYDKDGVYWAFYENGEYAQTGVDLTTITEGATYSFKIEK